MANNAYDIDVIHDTLSKLLQARLTRRSPIALTQLLAIAAWFALHTLKRLTVHVKHRALLWPPRNGKCVSVLPA